MDKYDELKAKHPDEILLYRMGDFFEAFDEDARTVASVLGLTLTWLENRLIAGFPHFYIATYSHKLIQAGHRVAIHDTSQ